MERRGTIDAGRPKPAAVSRKADAQKKRTELAELSIFFVAALVIAFAGTKTTARRGDEGNTAFPPHFNC